MQFCVRKYGSLRWGNDIIKKFSLASSRPEGKKTEPWTIGNLKMEGYLS